MTLQWPLDSISPRLKDSSGLRLDQRKRATEMERTSHNVPGCSVPGVFKRPGSAGFMSYKSQVGAECDLKV